MTQDAGRVRGDRAQRVWDLVAAYGPDVTRLCRAGPALIPGIGGLGLSAGMPQPMPPVRFSSDQTSARLETLQYRLGEGPCRDATDARAALPVEDLTAGSWRQRWPQFIPGALDVGVRAVLALPLHAGGVRHDGALDLYRRTPGPWNATAPATVVFAGAVAELLNLERLELDLGGAFARAHGSGDAASDGPDPALLVRWFAAGAAPALRTEVRTIAAAHGVRGEVLHLFVLAVHEAVTNALDHGGGHGQLVLWRAAGQLWCEISDHGPGIPDAVLDASDPARAVERDFRPGQGLWAIRRACKTAEITTDATGTRLRLSCRPGR